MKKINPNIKSRIWYVQNEFLILLLALSAFLFLPSFISDAVAKDVLIYSLLTILLVSGVFELRTRKYARMAAVVLAITTLGLNLFSVSENEDTLFLLRMLSLILFFLLLTGYVFYRLAIFRRISVNTIYCAISGYLLLGLMGGLAFRTIHHFYENAFAFSSGLQPRIDDFTYLSFVTLATLGYGDITPVQPPAQALAILLSVAGQMYLVVVIGIIIGKFNVYGRK